MRFKRISALRRSRDGSTTIWLCLSVPMLAGAMSLALEAANWAVTQQDLQRIADVSALAGSFNLGSLNNAQAATAAAARLAEVNLSNTITNGLTSASQVWYTGNSTTVDTITVNGSLVQPGYTYTIAATANIVANTISVVASTTAPQLVSQLFFNGRSTVAIAASSTAKAGSSGSSSGGGGQPCILLLSTTATLTASINTTGNGIQMPGCTIVSNGQTLLMGASKLTADALYSYNTFTNKGVLTGNFIGNYLFNNSGGNVVGTVQVMSVNNLSGAAITGNLNYDPPASNYGTQAGTVSGATTMVQLPAMAPVSDPYTSASALQNALTTVNAATTGINCTLASCGTATGSLGNWTLVPGTVYNGLAIAPNKTVNMPAGVYYFLGQISVGSLAKLTGTNVTILYPATSTHMVSYSVSIPMVSISGGTVTLTPPTTAQVTGGNTGVAGVVFASGFTQPNNAFIQVSGGSLNYSGLIYLPTAQFNVSGVGITIGQTASPTCAQLVANTLLVSSSASISGFFGANCTGYGLQTYNSWPASVVTTTASSSRLSQ